MKNNSILLIIAVLMLMLSVSNAFAVTMTVGSDSGDIDAVLSIPITVDDPTGIAGAAFTVVYSDSLSITVESSFFDTFINQLDPLDTTGPAIEEGGVTNFPLIDEGGDPVLDGNGDPVYIEIPAVVDSLDYYQPVITNHESGEPNHLIISAARCVPAPADETAPLFTLQVSLKNGEPAELYTLEIIPTELSNTAAGYAAEGETIDLLIGSDPNEPVTSDDAFPVILDDNGYAANVVNGSVTFSGTPVVTPPRPTGVNASDGTFTGKVQVIWNASEGATSYDVFRADMPAVQAKVVATSKRRKIASSVTATLYDDISAEFGKRYYYWVKAINASGGSKLSGNNTGYWGDSGSRPAKPTNVNATDGSFADRVNITWDAVADTLVYEIWRINIPIAVGGKMMRVGMTAETSFDDFTVESGNRYSYCVKSRNSWGAIKSNFDTGYIGNAAPKLPAPTGVSASDGNVSGKVNVIWNSVGGTITYEIWRATSSVEDGGNPKRIGYSFGTSYEDTSAAVGTTYYYWVKARNSWGSSKLSTPDTGYTN